MKMIHTLDWEKGRRKAQSPAGPVRHACMHQEPGRTDSKSWDNGDSPILPGPSSLNLTSSFPSCRVFSGTTTRRFSPRDPANALVPGLLEKNPAVPRSARYGEKSRFQAQSFNTAVLGHPGRPLSDPFPAASLRLFSGDSNPPRIVSGKPAPKLGEITRTGSRRKEHPSGQAWHLLSYLLDSLEQLIN